MFCRFAMVGCASVACQIPIDTNCSNKSWANQSSWVDHRFWRHVDTDLPTKLGFDVGFTIGIDFKASSTDIK